MCQNAATVSLRQFGAACSNMRVLLHVQEVGVPSYEMHVGYYTIILALLCNYSVKRNIGQGIDLVL